MPGGLDRAVAEIGERALHRDHALRRREQRRDRIVALDRGAAAALTAERAIEASSIVVRLGRGREPAACSKSRIAASVFGPKTPSTAPS